MNNNQNNPQEVPQVKSVELVSILEQCKNSVAITEGFSDWEQFVRVDPDSALDAIDRICDQYSYARSQKAESEVRYLIEHDHSNAEAAGLAFDELKYRIAELEAEKAKYRESLYSIIGYPSFGNHKIHEPLKIIAEQALNSKDNG